MSRKLTYQERRGIAQILIPYHGAFYKFWDIVVPSFESDANECPTARVFLNKEDNCINFQINEKFFNNLSQNQKAFVICHECLHVMLKHGSRSSFKEARMNPEISNMALDIPINHLLVDYFGFDRDEIDKAGNFCWIDTVFKEDEINNIEKNRNFEYYFQKIINSKHVNIINVPNHQYLSSMAEFGEEMVADAVSKLSNEDIESLTDISERQEKKAKNEKKDSGYVSKSNKNEYASEAGNLKKTIKTPPPKPKRKWETVVKKWAAGFVRSAKQKTHWVVKPRRLAGFNYGNMFIPSSLEMPKRNLDDKKIEVWIFQDTSGSCVSYAERFFKAFESLPKDVFNVKMHCFDTRVFKLTEKDIKNKTLYGFGGTSFQAIEDYIQSEIKKIKIGYPKAVFVLTDGRSAPVKLNQPKNWFWFLTENNSYAIPNECKKFMLADFE